jgi:cob(I)alamin adenosyltransferase
MNKIKIYTKNGDYGETSLCDGSKTSKDSLRVEAYGSVDELNSVIGMCIVKSSETDIKDILIEIQRDLHSIGANLAFPADLSQVSIKGPAISGKIPRVTEETIERLENWIDKFEEELPPLTHFILCGGNECSAQFHIARTVCRRAERRVVALKKAEEVNRTIIKYMNRLSDLLFIAARVVSKRAGCRDIEWMG